MNYKILAVDDEEDILELLRYNLTKEGCEIDCVLSGEQAISRTFEFQPDLILLDLMLPGLDGLEVCRILRRNEKTREIPIIMLTAKGEDGDIVKGLTLGADDYVVKPFSPKVLVARIQAMMRRKNRGGYSEDEQISVDGLTIDPSRFEVNLQGEPAKLTASEFNILHFLARNPGRVYTRQQIINTVKGTDYPVTDRSVDVQVVGLRKKLGEFGELIETVRGVGYRFKES